MSESPNPYEPPAKISAHDDEKTSWWARPMVFFRRPRGLSFENGEALVYEGIAYFINPEVPGILYAASPSADHSSERLELIAAESLRLLPRFLEDHPHLVTLVHGRGLSVRIIAEYKATQAEFVCDTFVDAVKVAAELKTGRSNT